jgi:hypothetical protein
VNECQSARMTGFIIGKGKRDIIGVNVGCRRSIHEINAKWEINI